MALAGSAGGRQAPYPFRFESGGDDVLAERRPQERRGGGRRSGGFTATSPHDRPEPPRLVERENPLRGKWELKWGRLVTREDTESRSHTPASPRHPCRKRGGRGASTPAGRGRALGECRRWIRPTRRQSPRPLEEGRNSRRHFGQAARAKAGLEEPTIEILHHGGVVDTSPETAALLEALLPQALSFGSKSRALSGGPDSPT